MVKNSFYHEIFQNMNFNIGIDSIETKNDPLNIPIFGFQLFFLPKLRSSERSNRQPYASVEAKCSAAQSFGRIIA